MKKAKGFTLIEFILALMLVSLILSSVIAVYLTAQKNFYLQLRLSKVEENARIAFELLHSSLRMAGYIGCLKLTNDSSFKTHSYVDITKKNRIIVNKSNITVWHASIVHANLIKAMRGYTVFYTSIKPSFSPNEILLISDCHNAELVQVRDVQRNQNEQKITIFKPLDILFAKNAEVSRLEIETFFVDKTKRVTLEDLPIYALYRIGMGKRKEELVEDIEDMKISFDSLEDGVGIELMVSFLPGVAKTWFSYIALRE